MTDSGNAPELAFGGDPPPEPVDPFAPDANAPYGYVIDEVTRERRPRKTNAGRRRGSTNTPQTGGGSTVPPGPPSLEQLRAGAPRTDRAPDRPPGARKDRRGRVRAPKAPRDVPPFRAGPIAKGVDQLYRKAGKLLRLVDPLIGQALIDITRKESADDVTVGEAWEEVAKTNPRIRAFLLRLITGGAWTQLLMAHAPVLLAVVMRDGIRERIPMQGLITSMLSDDDEHEPVDYWPVDHDQEPADTAEPSPFAPGMAGLFDGLRPEDIAQMSSMMDGFMTRMAAGVPRPPASSRAPTVEDFGAEVAAAAESPP